MYFLILDMLTLNKVSHTTGFEPLFLLYDKSFFTINYYQHNNYYPIINHPTTDYSTLQESLRVTKNVSREVDQKYAVTTFDLGVCMKAYPIIWKSPDFYDDHIVMIGFFHLICAYLKIIGKEVNESGLADVLLEVGVIFVGFMNGLMSGKNYSRAIN